MLEAIYYGVMALIVLFAVLQKPDTPSAEPGNPKHPTVSQSRKIPLAVGKTLVDGPNILDVGPLRIHSRSNGREQYHQDIEMAIAYGPGVLHQIWANDAKIWEGTMDQTLDEVYIDKPDVFGNSGTPGGGGMTGYAMYVAGHDVGHINQKVEGLMPGREQPGYPSLARVLFYLDTYRFYWGNAENFKPVSFVYAHYPNPLNHPVNHIVGAYMANPAYVLYALMKNTLWGIGSGYSIDTAAIAAMADTLKSEGLGIARTWYDKDAPTIEREILDLIDGVRYRSPITGDVVYSLLRDDFDIGAIPSLDDENIIELAMVGNGISSTPTKINLTYLDSAAHYKEKKITLSNVAARQILGRDVTISIDMFAASNAYIASQILTREAKKRTRPRREAKLITGREAWDWSVGDVFKLSSELEGFSNLVMRVTEHTKGDLLKREVEIQAVEELFSYGTSVFDVPTTGIGDNAVAPAEISNYYETITPPMFLVDAVAAVPLLFAIDPVGASAGFYVETGGVLETPIRSFTIAQGLSSALAQNGATTIEVDGLLVDATNVSSADFLAGETENILLIEESGVYEYVGFETSSFNSVTGVTTLTDVYRGLGGTFPRPFTTAATVWEVSTAASSNSPIAIDATWTHKLVDESGGTIYATPATINLAENNVSVAPTPPVGILIGGAQFPTTQRTGPLLVSWKNTSIDESLSGKNYYGWNDGPAATQDLPADTTVTLEFWDADGAPDLLQTVTGETGTSYSYSAPDSDHNLTVKVYATHATNGDSIVPFEHTLPFFQDPESIWTPSAAGSGVTLSNNSLTALGDGGTANIPTYRAYNEYTLTSTKTYYEVILDIEEVTFPDPVMGVVDTANRNVQGTSDYWSVQQRNGSSMGGAYGLGVLVVGDRLGIAVDHTTRKVWLRLNGGAWGGGGDPVLGTGEHKVLLGTGVIIPVCSVEGGSKVTANFEGSFVDTPPAGYTAWI